MSTEVIKLRPGNGGGLLGGGKLLDALDVFGRIKEIAAELNIEISRLGEIMPAISKAVSADYHTEQGMRDGLWAILTVADVLALDESTVSSVKEILDSNLLSLAVWLYNKITGYEPEVQPILHVEALSVPDLGKWLPIIMQIIELIRSLKG